jgi:putative hydrolase of the HAD superfamily
MKIMTLRGILLDLFGTLIAYGDQEAGMRASRDGLYYALVEAGAMIPVEQFNVDWDTRLFSPLAPHEDICDTPFMSKIRRLCGWYGLSLDEATMEGAATACLASWDSSIYLPEDTMPALSQLRPKVGLALVSNFDHPPFARKLLASTGLVEVLDPIIISGEVKVDKPDPRIFHLALERLGCSAEETLFVGDSLEADIAGSRAVGCRPVLIDRERRHADYGGERIETLLELVALLDYQLDGERSQG